jgi:asparagine synthase (glutamine-hydrolysing)
MSALSALFMRDGSLAERNMAERMRNAQRMYGPDREAVRATGAFALGWNHAIGFTPQDRNEFQPMNIGDRFEMLFAGRLDHREELAFALSLDPARLAIISDGELARMTWERWQDRAPDYLYGPYSYIICDTVEHRLEAVRSPIRATPLHWFATPDRFLIASMPKGLFALPDVPRILDEQKIADFLVLNQEDLDATFFQNIKSLPLGHRLVVDRHSLTVSRYYGIENTTPVRFKRDEDYVEAARNLLDQAVASAMRSVETPAITLSAGLDSTTVAVSALGWMERQGNSAAKPLLGMTSVPGPGWDGRAAGLGDESGPVRALASLYPKLAVQFVDTAGAPIDDGLDAITMAGDMPSRGVGNLHWGMEIARRVKADGRKVILNGSGGNAALSLSGAIFVFHHWARQGRLLHAAQQWRKWAPQSGPSGLGIWRGFASHILWGLAPGIREAIRTVRPPQGTLGWRGFSGIDHDHARTMQIDERMAAMNWVGEVEAYRSHRAIMRRMLDRGNRHASGARVLAHQAATGIDSRDPLSDRKLTEFCYAIPEDQYFRDGVDRWLVRRVMAGRLPAAVLDAPRGVQSADWLVRLRQDAARFDAELERMAEDPAMATRLDIPRMRALLTALPERTPLSVVDHPEYRLARFGLGYALSVARFIHSVEGRNR